MLSIEFSFLSSSEEKYNRITGTKDNYRIMMENCSSFLEIFGSENVMANMVILPENYQEVYQAGKLLNQKGVKILATGTPIFSGKSIGLASLDYILMIRETYKQLRILNEKFGMKTYLGGCIPFCIFEGVDRNFPISMNKGCEAGGKVLAIGSDGNVRPCIEYPFTIGNILNDKFELIWNHPILEKLRNYEFAPTCCRNCESVKACKGGCRVSAMKNPKGIDPYLDRFKNN